MKITKFGHCCLLIEEDSLRILTDPGNYNTTPNIKDIDVILITHEHQDHCHVDALREILAKNEKAKIITHTGVERILKEASIPCMLVTDGEEKMIQGVSIESSGSEHACVHHDLPPVQNTGFYINKKLFYPGDSFHNPQKQITLLALPVSGPWMKLEECIEYANAVQPKIVFPVHDGMLRQEHQLGPTRRIPQILLEPLGIRYVDMREGTITDFDALL